MRHELGGHDGNHRFLLSLMQHTKVPLSQTFGNPSLLRGAEVVRDAESLDAIIDDKLYLGKYASCFPLPVDPTHFINKLVGCRVSWFIDAPKNNACSITLSRLSRDQCGWDCATLDSAHGGRRTL